MSVLINAESLRSGDVVHLLGEPGEHGERLRYQALRAPSEAADRGRARVLEEGRAFVTAVESFRLASGAYVALRVERAGVPETFSLAAATMVAVTPGPNHHAAAPLDHCAYARQVERSVGVTRAERFAAAKDRSTAPYLLAALAVVSPESDVLDAVTANPATPSFGLAILAARTRWAEFTDAVAPRVALEHDDMSL